MKSFLRRVHLALIGTVLVTAASLVFADNPDTPEVPTVKNVIIMISDGCGFNHIKAASYYQYGVENGFVFHQFPVQLAMSTYNLGLEYDSDRIWGSFYQAPQFFTDSAASGTAITSGYKTSLFYIGLNADAQYLPNLVDYAESLGKMTGVVVSGAISDATPAAFAAHNISRTNQGEIAEQLFNESALDVLMGCGHPYYGNYHEAYDDSSDRINFAFVSTHNNLQELDQARADWTQLTQGNTGGDADGDGIDDHWAFYETKDSIVDLISDENPPKRVLAIAQVRSGLSVYRGPYDEGDEFYADAYEIPFMEDIPTLEQMTLAGLNVLKQDPDGFLMMIEGSHIDSASHKNFYGRLIEEEIFFAQTVQAVVDWVEQNSSWDETLLIVTADHETGMLWGPGSGPGPDGSGPILNPIVNNGQGQMPGLRFYSNPLHNDMSLNENTRNHREQKHTNMLVPFFAKGAGSELFPGRIKTKMTYLSKGQGSHVLVPVDQPNTDPVYGPYIDNTDIYPVVTEVLK